MMYRPVTVMLITIAGLFFINACQSIPSLPPPPTPAVTPVLTSKVIATESVSSLEEVGRLTVKDAGAVAALAFTPEAHDLLAVYAQEGVLRQWRLADRTLQRTLDIRPVELGAVSFDATRKLLATGAGVNWEAHKLDDDYLGLRVWNIATGKLILRVGEDYHPPSGFLTRTLFPSVNLTPDGTWVVAMYESASNDLARLKRIFQVEVATGQPGTAFVNFGRKREEDDFDVIAFDATGEFFAAADESGQVAIFRSRPPKHPIGDHLRQAVVEPPRNLGPKPLALAFDPRRQWLAGVRGNELLVWDLQSFGYPRQIIAQVSDTIGPTASLAFHPDGNLLAVGTINGWQIWDVKRKKLVAYEDGNSVYTVTFSPDGKLFAWGDTFGIVHIWGIPNR